MRVKTENGILGWCPTHRKLEPCTVTTQFPHGRLDCRAESHNCRKEEIIALGERDRRNPETLLKDIRDDIREIRSIQEENVTETRPVPPPPPLPPKPSSPPRVTVPQREASPVPDRRGVAL